MQIGRPVNIRRNIQNFGDPYLQTASPNDAQVCGDCKSVYHGQRWHPKEQVAATVKPNGRAVSYTLCPACLKIRDRMPGGIVHMSGGFLSLHREEILNLIRNEGHRAEQVNPLERVMDVETVATGMDVLTTNEHLAQRIGKALHKAYNGQVNYVFSQDTKLARVSWTRE